MKGAMRLHEKQENQHNTESHICGTILQSISNERNVQEMDCYMDMKTHLSLSTP